MTEGNQLRGAFPVWRCGSGHVNDLLRGACRACGESRPCQNCGGRPARLYANGMWCDGCELVAPDSFVRATESGEAPLAVREEPREVLESRRPSQADQRPRGINALVKWCEEQEIAYETAWGVVRIGERYVESSVFMAQASNGEAVFVAYEGDAERVDTANRLRSAWVRGEMSTLKFKKALLSRQGKGTLTDAKRALGIEVKERAPSKPRAKRETKPAEAKEGLR